MGHHEVAVLIGDAQLGGAADGAFLLIQAVHVALAVHAGKAGDARYVGELIGVGLVHGVGGLAGNLLRERPEQRCAQDGGVVDARVHDVVAYRLVDGEDAALGGAHGAAVAGKGVDVRKADALLIERIEDGLAAVSNWSAAQSKAASSSAGWVTFRRKRASSPSKTATLVEVEPGESVRIL